MSMGRFLLGLALIFGGIVVVPYYKLILEIPIEIIESFELELTKEFTFFLDVFPMFVIVVIFAAGGWFIVSSFIRRSESGNERG